MDTSAQDKKPDEETKKAAAEDDVTPVSDDMDSDKPKKRQSTDVGKTLSNIKKKLLFAKKVSAGGDQLRKNSDNFLKNLFDTGNDLKKKAIKVPPKKQQSSTFVVNRNIRKSPNKDSHTRFGSATKV